MFVRTWDLDMSICDAVASVVVWCINKYSLRLLGAMYFWYTILRILSGIASPKRTLYLAASCSHFAKLTLASVLVNSGFIRAWSAAVELLLTFDLASRRHASYPFDSSAGSIRVFVSPLQIPPKMVHIRPARSRSSLESVLSLIATSRFSSISVNFSFATRSSKFIVWKKDFLHSANNRFSPL